MPMIEEGMKQARYLEARLGPVKGCAVAFCGLLCVDYYAMYNDFVNK